MRILLSLLLTSVCFLQPAMVQAQENFRIELDPPGQRDFILDRANLITPEDEAEIKELADKLLTDTAAPLVIVTINSMSEHGGMGLRIETFARLLFDQWQIGPAEVNKNVWNKGILLLVSKNDRKARIELGAGWGREKDQLCQKIMNEQIIPRFKEGDYSAGIKAGAISLERMARDLKLPAAPKPAWYYPVMIGVVALGIFTVVSMIRRGTGGWAWLFWGFLFAAIGTVLYHMATSSGSSSGGGFSGGSFGGGGFSGGGGASGSW
ncbi:TPM domain-containing protein [Rubinisphaera margarita]|uniref:TPM domain-containing protein n=1 Tax=Rubinisphaera margarita TaxID=2909586 RepID=UPI001EE791BF|nr:TPM domain-containing protein [Rubinisphaera margarita]MCG6155306.1 TPM domain-containing protein [Rubinisphaera margarita]